VDDVIAIDENNDRDISDNELYEATPDGVQP
jgi:hypothetical protein